MASGDDTKMKVTKYGPENSDKFKIFARMKDKEDHVQFRTITECCAKEGLHICSDPRFYQVFETVKTIRGKCLEDVKLNFQKFEKMVSSHELIVRALNKNLAVPNWEEFAKVLELLYQAYYLDSDGTPARHSKDYCKMSTDDMWGLSVFSVDGQKFLMGDTDKLFTMQACCRPFLYALVLDVVGFDVVHSFCGMEPVPYNFMEAMLNEERKPYNPLNIGGALVCCALWQNSDETGKTRAEKFEKFICLLRGFTGNVILQCDNVATIDEKEKSNMVQGVIHNLKYNECLPPETDINATLDFYFQINCLKVTSDVLALMSATLANDGINPRSETVAIKPETARHTLSLLRSCGVYNTDQDFCFDIGVPAKFSKSGAGLFIVPGFFGLGMYSPFMTEFCKSRRAIKFVNILSAIYHFHPFDSATEAGTLQPANRKCSLNCPLFNAAEKGEVETLARMVASGSNMTNRDYMRRTLLHTAAAEGHLHVCRFIMAHCPNLLEMKDNMNQTALDDAVTFKRDQVVDFLSNWVALRGGERPVNKILSGI